MRGSSEDTPPQHRTFAGRGASGRLRQPARVQRSADGAQILPAPVFEEHEGAIVESKLAGAVVLDDLDLAEAVARGTLVVVGDGERVRVGGGGAVDREALGPVAGGHVRVEPAAAGEVRLAVPGDAALAVLDV